MLSKSTVSHVCSESTTDTKPNSIHFCLNHLLNTLKKKQKKKIDVHIVEFPCSFPIFWSLMAETHCKKKKLKQSQKSGKIELKCSVVNQYGCRSPFFFSQQQHKNFMYVYPTISSKHLETLEKFRRIVKHKTNIDCA